MEKCGYDITLEGVMDILFNAQARGEITPFVQRLFGACISGIAIHCKEATGNFPKTLRELMTFTANQVKEESKNDFADSIIMYTNTFSVLGEDGFYSLGEITGVDIIEEMFNEGSWAEQQELISRVDQDRYKTFWVKGARTTKYLELANILPKTSWDIIERAHDSGIDIRKTNKYHDVVEEYNNEEEIME